MFEISYKRDGKLITETHDSKDAALAHFFAIAGIGMGNRKRILGAMAELDTNRHVTAFAPSNVFTTNVPANMPMPRVRPVVLSCIGMPPTVHGVQ